VSHIPFFDRLGDTLEAAIRDPMTARRAARRRARRLGGLALAAVLLVGGTIAAARILTEPEKLASVSIGCHLDPDLRDGGSFIWADGQDPVAACKKEYAQTGTPVPSSMIACTDPAGSVAVIPGREGDCQRHGLEPLPFDYRQANAKVAKFQRDVMALERHADCIPPRELARRVQALLERSGWTGWTTWLRSDMAGYGPCGSVSGLGGGGQRSISGALDAEGHRVMIFGGPARSTMDLLYGPHGLSAPLQDQSATRCFSVSDLQAHARRRVEPTGRRVSFNPVGPLDAGTEMDSRRMSRYQAGCAVIHDVVAAGNGRDVVVSIVQKG
jgi:hypothetical protein